ncbi:MAG: hypothetical protein Q7S66_05860 [bacterium]|nr:hypothetical protein [bacterium]
MPRKKYKILNQIGGFGLIEVVVGVAIMAGTFVALAGIARFSLSIIDNANFELRSAFLMSEGVEAVKIIRDQGWTSNIAPLANGTTYYLSYASGAWSITALPQPAIDDLFQRTVTFAQVRRDVSDNIVSSGGSIDSGTRQVTVQVTWQYLGRTYTYSIVTYITNLFAS